MEISAICRRDRISKQNEVAIIIRLYHNGIVRKITSGLRIKVDYWDFDNNCLKNGIPNQEHLQYLLDKQIQEFKKRELEYKIQGKNYSIDDIIGIKKKPAMTVEEYFQKIINELSDLGRLNTRDKYKFTLSSLNKFRSTKISFTDMDFQFLKEYLDTYLKEKTIEEVHTELSQYKARVGAKSDHTINRIITQLYHFLQEETPYHDPQGKKTDKICTFIARFLSLMGYITILPDEEEFNIRQKERKESKILKDWIATIRTKISDNLKWEETNGKFKSVTNEILSHKSYKEYNSEGVTLDTPLSELFPKYW